MKAWTDPRSPIWQGLRLSVRFRLTEAMKHLLAHGVLRRSDIQTIGEVSTAQASSDIRELISRTNALIYDRSRKLYVLKVPQ